MKKAVLLLEDGSVFTGYSVGVEGDAGGEVVFNTAMTGYQEIITDPSYARQIVTFTHPHIGNTGCNEEDNESSKVWLSGIVFHDLPLLASNWRKQETLAEFLQKNAVVAIAGVDTRALTAHLRDKGALRGVILAGKSADNYESKVSLLKQVDSLQGLDLAQEVTTDTIIEWREGVWAKGLGHSKADDSDLKWHVVAYDFGVKRNILRLLVSSGCRVTIVPATTSAEEVLKLKPDGVFLSNGPGDPAACHYAIKATQHFLQRGIPLFGICLGFQLLMLAAGAKTYKMKFGHHGANHPVQDLSSKKVLITSQNHGFAVDSASLPKDWNVTHLSLFDNSLQGCESRSVPAFGFQGHPEASPGPHDLHYLFDKFVELIKNKTC